MCLLKLWLYYVPLRYYVAEGVRIYSQETWRVVTENRGVQLVEEYIGNVVSVRKCDTQNTLY